MSSSYVPPHKRKTKSSTPNMFRGKAPPPKTPTPPPPETDNLESFPQLGDKEVVPQPTSTMNFAEYIKKIQEKKKPKILPGWVQIKKVNNEIVYKYGKRPKNNHVKMRNEFERARRLNARYRLEDHLDRLEAIRQYELELSGGDSIESWQVNDYIKEKKKQERDYDSESSSSSEYDEDEELNPDLV